MYAPCYVSSDKKGTESMAGNTGKNIKWQLFGLSKRLTHSLRYMFRYGVLISKMLQHLATHWGWWCQILHVLL